MNVVAIFVIVVMVALYVAARVLMVIFKEINDAKNGVVHWLGRKHSLHRAFVPPELEEKKSPLPRSDIDKSHFSRYDPQPIVAFRAHIKEFKSPSEEILRNEAEISRDIDIGRLPDLLSMSQSLPYKLLFSMSKQDVCYPIPPPTKPKEIDPPPIWTPWGLEFKEPSFSAPHYAGWLSFLNKFVDASYRDEVSKVAQAKRRRDDLLEVCRKRNLELDGLAKEAAERRAKSITYQEKAFENALADYKRYAKTYEDAFRKEQEKIANWIIATQEPGEAGLLARVEWAMRTTTWPPFVSTEGQSKFDAASGVLIHEHRFPDISDVDWVKQVELKSGWTTKPANQKEKREAVAKLYPSICLRLAAEIARLDGEGILKAVAVNGWANYTEKATGQRKRAYCASLFATKEQMATLNFSALDAIAAFGALKGITAHSLELTPIAPILRLDMNDPRFIDAKEVLAHMAQGENLAIMDWADFEHLCRELFERAFANTGAQVKVTQASRDQGVDAIIFDPDPLRGGKIVVQAKRYTNTVDVSAVRDLYGAVINEGATKGILVTTSHYGPDAYSFAKDKPLTLLSGRELLGLLETYGYRFRIDLHEAKAML